MVYAAPLTFIGEKWTKLQQDTHVPLYKKQPY